MSCIPRREELRFNIIDWSTALCFEQKHSVLFASVGHKALPIPLGSPLGLLDRLQCQTNARPLFVSTAKSPAFRVYPGGSDTAPGAVEPSTLSVYLCLCRRMYTALANAATAIRLDEQNDSILGRGESLEPNHLRVQLKLQLNQLSKSVELEKGSIKKQLNQLSESLESVEGSTKKQLNQLSESVESVESSIKKTTESVDAAESLENHLT